MTNLELAVGIAKEVILVTLIMIAGILLIVVLASWIYSDFVERKWRAHDMDWKERRLKKVKEPVSERLPRVGDIGPGISEVRGRN